MSAHLEKVLHHAERKLQGLSQKSNRDQLDLYRNFLHLEEQRLRMAHKAGAGGVEFAEKRSDLFTVVLRHIFSTAVQSGQSAHAVDPASLRLALVAVGGFGRGHLAPFSDIDILFLYEKPKTGSPAQRFITDVVEQVLYLLWDSGIKVGHASRDLDQAIEQGKEDFQTATSLLESRLLSGPEDLFEQFQRRFHRLCIQGKEQAYMAWRSKDQELRHEKFGNTVFVQEPQVKNGCGGLRDYHNLLWSAHVTRGFKSLQEIQQGGLLTVSERKALDAAYDFILRIRTELHYQQNRAGDILTLRLQGNVANAFKYPQRTILLKTEALMKDYYVHSNTLYHIGGILFRRLQGRPVLSGGLFRNLLPRRATQTERIDAFLLNSEKELEAVSPSIFSEDPLRLLRVFQIMQQRGVGLSPDLQTLIAAKAHLLHRRYLTQPAGREILFHIAAQKGRTGRIFRAMHRTGLLARVIPEFAPLTFLVQHEFYHRYTADEHTLVCLEQLDRVLDDDSSPFVSYRTLYERCADPAILTLALILHDTGKGGHTRDHSVVSSQLASRFARRMRITGRRLQLLLFLVDHHMTLTEFALRRNLDDAHTIREFARIVQDPERLDLLMLLSLADGMGTGAANNWTDWKEGLVWHLYTRTRSMLAGEEEFLRQTEKNRADVEASLRKSLPKPVDEAEFRAHIRSLPPRYLSFRNEALILRHLALVHEFLIGQMRHESVRDALAPVIHWQDSASAGYTGVTIVSWDRSRLFSKIAGAFALAQINILGADVWTRSDNIVIDTFQVSTEKFTAVTHQHDRTLFANTLTRALLEPDYDIGTEINRAHSFSRKADHYTGLMEPMVGFDNEASPEHTLMHLRAPDYLGLLYDVSASLAAQRLSINTARITTEKGAALDTFYLTTPEGKKIEDRIRLRKIHRAVIAALEPHIR
jgi:[protein-PII] uridylyltransferase